MEKSFSRFVLFIFYVLFDSVCCFPVDFSSFSEGVSNPSWLTNYVVTGIGFCLIIVTIIFGCVCCRNGKGFKEFRNSTGNLAVSSSEGITNPTLNSELTIFPPLGAHANEICRFEPLPDITSKAPNLRPATFSYTEQEISSQDWFFDPYSNFPRNQLKYLREYGRGWFGRVVEGEAQNITPEEKVTKVMVKILHEDATATDRMYFLHEVKFYRDLKHPNILRLLGQCLETEPFLIILECYPNGDLKTFLSQNLPSAQALVEQGVTLQMCSNITSGLQFMHDNKFIHTDLAARNCLVGVDLKIKIGDYGNSIEIFKSDYYCAGSVALPVRWCAPETLKCTDITIETREVTPPANIWSLGIVFWEICEFCKLPYSELNDDQVIVRVLGEKNYFLNKPNMNCLHKEELYHLMKLCWKSPVQRPTASQINVVLNNLISSRTLLQKNSKADSKEMSQDFEERWKNFKPNCIPKKDNAIDTDYEPSVDCSIISSKLKNARVVDSSYVESPLGLFMSSKNSEQESPRFCLKVDKNDVSKIEKVPLRMESVCENAGNIDLKKDNLPQAVIEQDHQTGLNKTSENIINPTEKIRSTNSEMDSWLKGVEINNEEDESFVRKISEAIRDLDATLALEKTSSSEESSGKSSRENSPGKDMKEENEPVIDFKLGKDISSFMNFTQKNFELTSLQNTEQPQSLNFTDSLNVKESDENEKHGSSSLILPFIQNPFQKCKNEVLDESLKDSSLCAQSRNSSDTDDEIWRKRIERGEISEKVKEKSKSIANLMILTHIDSDDSDIDMEKPFDKGLNRSSFIRRSGSYAKSSLSSNNFGSENDLTFAVLEDDFKESIKKLRNDHKEHGHFDSLGVILPPTANRENVWESLFKTSDPLNDVLSQANVNKPTGLGNKISKEKNLEKTELGSNFLGDIASEKHKSFVVNDDKILNNILTDEKYVNNSKEETPLTKENLSCDIEDDSYNCFDLVLKSSHLRIGNANFDTQINRSNVFKEDNEESESILSKKDKINTKDEIKSDNSKNVSFCLNKSNLLENELNKPTVSTEKTSCSIPKDNSCIPHITITEEPNETFVEYDEAKFELKKPDLKSYKFVFQDNQTLGDKTKTDLQSALPFVNEKLLTATAESNDTSDKSTTVIFGACEDDTMDYFRGLKTTTENFEIKSEKIDSGIVEPENYEENLSVWDEHLGNVYTQQLNNRDFDDVTFKNVSSEIIEFDKNASSPSVLNDYDRCQEAECSVKSIVDFIHFEKLHTEKLEESINSNQLTSLSLMSNEEDYEHFKLRTPDDERSSDSGFRDKGSLSESVEDACDVKYNLEDIEAELEEAFVKGVFGNCETERNKEGCIDLKNSNNFEYEESKFYESGSKNDEDLSDIDGEIEFYHNRDDSDYYPEISEFHPTCSQGWYLHPPDDSVINGFHRNVNEDIVNALRNELRENLPIQSRSFEEFNEFYETEMVDPKRDTNFHYISDFSVPLSPILEEQDTSAITTQKNSPNALRDEGRNALKERKNGVKLLESVKAVDTNTFIRYLDYMIENEGKDLDDIEGSEEEFDESRNIVFPSESNSEDIKIVNNSKLVNDCVSSKPIVDLKDAVNVSNTKTKIDSLDVKGNPVESTLIVKVERILPSAISETEIEILGDISEKAVLTSENTSPDRDRSLSEMSPSSNGTRSGDALSEITLSSPDLVSDCFSAFVQEAVCCNELNDEEFNHLATEYTAKSHEEDSLKDGTTESQNLYKNCLINQNVDKKQLDVAKINQIASDQNHTVEVNNLYEMSTSFMEVDEDEDISSNLETSEQNHLTEAANADDKTCRNSITEDSDTGGWQSDDSESEQSSSSGEFIWKLYERAENNQNDQESDINGCSKINNSQSLKENVDDDDEEEEENNDDDDNDSSTGSSASLNDFVPSAWNSQATPSRSSLKSYDKNLNKGKKNVWFKKQKYHCVYEYPREPSDNEETESSLFKPGLDLNISDTPIKHFNYGVSPVELSNQHFPFGISKPIDYSLFTDWDFVEEDNDLSLTDTDSENGSGKSESKKSDHNFYNLSPFDYDFNNSDMLERESEFFVSSSSRPFQGSSSVQLSPELSLSIHSNSNNMENKGKNNNPTASKDFITPDSGIDDSATVTPSDKTNLNGESVPLTAKSATFSKEGIINILDSLKLNLSSDVKENGEEQTDFKSFKENKKGKREFFNADNSSIAVSGTGLGELRHTRDKLKLDLPINHNSDLGAIINKKV